MRCSPVGSTVAGAGRPSPPPRSARATGRSTWPAAPATWRPSLRRWARWRSASTSRQRCSPSHAVADPRRGSCAETRPRCPWRAAAWMPCSAASRCATSSRSSPCSPRRRACCGPAVGSCCSRSLPRAGGLPARHTASTLRVSCRCWARSSPTARPMRTSPGPWPTCPTRARCSPCPQPPASPRLASARSRPTRRSSSRGAAPHESACARGRPRADARGPHASASARRRPARAAPGHARRAPLLLGARRGGRGDRGRRRGARRARNRGAALRRRRGRDASASRRRRARRRVRLRRGTRRGGPVAGVCTGGVGGSAARGGARARSGPAGRSGARRAGRLRPGARRPARAGAGGACSSGCRTAAGSGARPLPRARPRESAPLARRGGGRARRHGRGSPREGRARARVRGRGERPVRCPRRRGHVPRRHPGAARCRARRSPRHRRTGGHGRARDHGGRRSRARAGARHQRQGAARARARGRRSPAPSHAPVPGACRCARAADRARGGRAAPLHPGHGPPQARCGAPRRRRRAAPDASGLRNAPCRGAGGAGQPRGRAARLVHGGRRVDRQPRRRGGGGAAHGARRGPPGAAAGGRRDRRRLAVGGGARGDAPQDAPAARRPARAVMPPGRSDVPAFVDELVRAGIRDACLMPGSRSTPLALALARHPGLRTWSHVDERSGGYFALGLAKATRCPVVVACTSGTAAANLFPAVVEAFYGHVPLVVLTADRPPELRDCAAGQTIDQLRLFGTHVRWFVELDAAEAPGAIFHARTLACRAAAAAAGPPPGPVHVNCPFREPLPTAFVTGCPAPDGAPRTRVGAHALAPAPAALAQAAAALAGARRPLVVCGPLDDPDPALPEAVAALAAALGAPVIAEPTSNLRRPPLAAHLVDAHDALARTAAFAETHAPDAIVRLGAPPTSKALGARLGTWPARVHLVLDGTGTWPEPTGAATHLLHGPPAATAAALAAALGPPRPDDGWGARWRRAGSAARRALAAAVAQERAPFEAHAVRALAAVLPAQATLYVGNSLAVRALDAFWPANAPAVRVLANRGASGIDGFVSSVLGAAAGTGPVVGLGGDLAFYHDMSVLLAARGYGLRLVLVVLDNDGGGIFHFLPTAECDPRWEELFVTPHGLDFQPAAEMYGAAFVRVREPAALAPALIDALAAAGTTVVALDIARTASVAAHARARAAAQAALGGPP